MRSHGRSSGVERESLDLVRVVWQVDRLEAHLLSFRYRLDNSDRCSRGVGLFSLASVVQVRIRKSTLGELQLDSRRGSLKLREPCHLAHGLVCRLRGNRRVVCLGHLVVGGVSMWISSLYRLRLGGSSLCSSR